MTAAESLHPERIWISPTKLWNATQQMTGEERDRLLESVQDLAEKRDVVSLTKYDFIRVGRYPDIRWD